MNLYHYQYILTWTETDLAALPSENEIYEYKSSLTKDTELGNKISVAASAFWNSGGGIFIVGIDSKTRTIDGGITEKIGNQDRRDWVDLQLKKTEPRGKYLVNLIRPASPTSLIKPNHVVLVIAFDESHTPPHMAFDNKYYVRIGAHSDSARHFIIEALRSRQVVQTPIIRALLRRSDQKAKIVELVLSVLNDASAIDVSLDFDPLPKMLGIHFADNFPLNIPVITRSHPFSMELYAWGGRSEIFGEESIKLKLSFNDLMGRGFNYEQVIDATANIDPMRIGSTDLEEIEKSIKEVSKGIKTLNTLLERSLSVISLSEKKNVEG